MNTGNDKWRIHEKEWKEGERRWVVDLPIARPRTRPPKPVQLILSLDGLRQLRARIDRIIAKATRATRATRATKATKAEKDVQDPQEVAQPIPARLIRPGLTWGRAKANFFVYATTAKDLRGVPDAIDGVAVIKRVTGPIRPARAGRP
jgi:hypothetical protein